MDEYLTLQPSIYSFALEIDRNKIHAGIHTKNMYYKIRNIAKIYFFIKENIDICIKKL